MASIPLALSIHNFINKVGADAGFASIIGLAILVLLYFAQARETATLRDHAAEAAQRIQHLEARVSQLVRSQSAPGSPAASASASAAAGPIVASRGVSGSARPGAAPRRAAAPAGVGTLLPAAPAMVGAPALTAATKLIPTPVPGSAELPVPVALQEVDAGATPPPATVAGAGNGHRREGNTDRFNGPPSPVAAPSGPPQPPPRMQIRPGQGPARRPPAGVPRARTGTAHAGPSRRALVAAAVVGALVVAALVIGLLAFTSSGGGNSKTNAVAASNAPARSGHAQTAGVNPAKVTVAVLNGTATAHLANRVGALLGSAGYQKGTVTNAPDQTHTATVVAYLPGFKKDALAVAKSLKVSAGSVQAIDPSTQAVACPAAPAACPANVVVTVGADLAGTQ